MKALKMYQVDVFTKEYFKGNPAAVCILDNEIEDKYMRLIAAEMNLSETAFVLPIDKEANIYSLRWFTPEVEVNLCGHGTIGTSKVLFDVLGIEADEIIFETMSGKLTAKKYDNGIGIDLPLDKPEDIEMPIGLLEAMGIKDYEDVKIGENTRKIIIKIKEESDIIQLKPNFEQMKSISFTQVVKGVAVTTNNSDKYDFISRYFNPWAGVNEDPVTGSVHTVLAPYWREILNKNEMIAYQASPRGGEILLNIKNGNRIELIGNSIIVLKGEIIIPI